MGNINISLGTFSEEAKRGYKYRDFDPKFELRESQHDYSTNDDLEAIRGGIRNLFTWRRGQRIIEPEFGNTLIRYLYEPINPVTLLNMETEIVRMFTVWEKRVKIVNIDIQAIPDENQVNITVEYTVPGLTDQVINFSHILNDETI